MRDQESPPEIFPNRDILDGIECDFGRRLTSHSGFDIVAERTTPTLPLLNARRDVALELCCS